MLNVIVLIAMAVTAAAFAAGLTVQAGLPLLPVLIGTAALFLVMAASFLSMGRGSRGASAGGDRLDELEEALEIIDTDLQRIDKVEDNVARIDGLSQKVEQLDRAMAASGDATGGQSHAAFAMELDKVYARIESLRTEVQAESRSQRDRIANDLGVLEGLIKRFSSDLEKPAAPETGRAAFGLRHQPPPVAVVEEEVAVEIARTAEPEPAPEQPLELEPEPEPEIQPEPEPEPGLVLAPEPEVTTEPEIVTEPEGSTVPEVTTEPEIATEPELVLAPEAEIAPEPEPKSEPKEPEATADKPQEPEASEDASSVDESEPLSTDTLIAEDTSELEPVVTAEATDFFDDDEDERMLNIIRQGIEQGRVDLYLQPTVTLPDRKVRYFEALTRIREADGALVMPGEYMPVAKRSALMPLIDNVLLVRSIQVLRRLGPDTRIKGVFGNVSMHSLLDADYYPELIEFMEENNSLSENLVFEISQAEMQGLTRSELSCLDTLGALGYTFCLDNVADIDTDFSSLSDRYFRYVKVSAESFLGGPGRKASDLKRQLDGLGMQLIIEKVEKEGDVADLLDHGIEFAQGHLFGAPQPMNAALSRELENAGAL